MTVGWDRTGLSEVVPGGQWGPCESTVEAEWARGQLSALTVGEVNPHLNPWALGEQWRQAGPLVAGWLWGSVSFLI